MAQQYLDAKEIASTFFQKTNRRATKATFGQAINQSIYLLKAGFNKKEIIQGIDYCVENPPPKGFNSIGWLSYVLEDVLIKIKAQQVKQEINKIDVAQEVEINVGRVQKSNERRNNQSSKRENYNFELFE